MIRRLALLVALVACVGVLIGCDHATKMVAESALRDRPPLAIVPGVIDLAYTENRDIAFSALERLSLHPSSAVIIVFALLAVGIMVVAWARRARGWTEHVGFALIVAGALGNLVDRFVRGHVVDFIHVTLWPVFNLADVFVVAGVGLLLLLGSRAPRAA